MPLPQVSQIRFQPLYQERVWGGDSLACLFGRRLPQEGVPYGESWELCDREEAQSVVSDGPLKGMTLHELWAGHREEIFGARYLERKERRFPLLIKILDAQENLSFQVHPHDRHAGIVTGEAKSEAWYVAHARPDATVYTGLTPGLTPESLQEHLVNGRIETCTLSHKANAGECFAIPGGTLHAIGAGLVIYEIQQNSDTTYRVYDWGRVGLDGKARELHLEDAMMVLDLDTAPPQPLRRSGTDLLQWPYFSLKLFQGEEIRNHVIHEPGAFAVGAVARGQVRHAGENFQTGDFFLVPASARAADERWENVSAESQLLWITLD